MADRPANIALLIDADNARPSAVDAVLTVLAELGTVNIRRAYANWAKGLKSWEATLHRRAIAPVQQFDLTTRKNATDMALLIDAMDLLHGGRVDGFGIMSSDSDFTPLVQRLRQDGLPVYGFGEAKAPQPFKDACTRFIDVAGLVKPPEAAVPSRGKPSAAAAAKQTTEVVKKAPTDRALIQLLVEAYEAAPHDELGFALLSHMSNNIHARSSFDARSYGFKRMSDLIAALPNFELDRRDKLLFVRRSD